MAEKRNRKKIDIYAVSVHDCTQEQNGSPYFSFPSFENAMAFVIKIQKFCYHGKGLSNNYQEGGLRNELQRENYYVVSPRSQKRN